MLLQIHSLQLSCFNSLPDDDSDLLVFDYFVDESGEWDTWHPRCQYSKLVKYTDKLAIYTEMVILSLLLALCFLTVQWRILVVCIS